mgnify:CR=1 FL=1
MNDKELLRLLKDKLNVPFNGWGALWNPLVDDSQFGALVISRKVDISWNDNSVSARIDRSNDVSWYTEPRNDDTMALRHAVIHAIIGR